MKRTTVLTIALLALLSAASCEKEITYTGEQKEKKIVLFAVAKPGEAFEMQVSHSLFFLDTSVARNRFIASLDTVAGEVTISVNGSSPVRMMTTVHEDDYYYFYPQPLYYACSYIPKSGDRIRVEARFPGFDPVSAETVVPWAPVASVNSARYVATGGKQELQVSYSITDDASYDKYYGFFPFLSERWEDDETGTSSWYGYYCDFESNDPIFKQNSSNLSYLLDEDDFTGYIEDSFIKGRKYDFSITIHLNSGFDPYKYDEDWRMLTSVRTVTPGLFNYVMTYGKGGSNSIEGIFAEGVTLYGNVEGGYGCLGAVASVGLNVDLSEIID